MGVVRVFPKYICAARLTSVISAIYRNPVFHQVVFATIMFTNVFRTTYILRTSPYKQLIPDHDKKTVTRLFSLGAATFLFGFFVWNLDNIFCHNITGWKHSLGWPGAFLLEGHSWWHVLTVSHQSPPPCSSSLTCLAYRPPAPTSCSSATLVRRISSAEINGLSLTDPFTAFARRLVSVPKPWLITGDADLLCKLIN